MNRGDLTDEQWNKWRSLLPKRKKTGRPAADDRRVINGILWILRAGAPWRDLPERYGKWGTISSRFYRWRQAGVFDRLFAVLQQEVDALGRIDWQVHFVDGTVIRTHQHAAGSKKRPVRRSLRAQSRRF